MKKILGVLLVMLCSACAVNPHVAQMQREVEVLEQQVQAQPGNPELRYQLASQYRQLAVEARQRQYRELAVQHFNGVLAIVPDHVPSLLMLYSMHYGGVVVDLGEQEETTLREIFARLPEDTRKEMQPPSLASFMREHIRQAIRGEQQPERLLPFLADAIAEQPYSEIAYMTLSEIHSDAGRVPLAIAVLQQGVERVPESGRMHAYLAEIYENRATESDCMYEDLYEVQQALHHYRQAVQSDPEQATWRWGLSDTYRRLGLTPMALNELQVAWQLEPVEHMLFDLSGHYLLLGDREAARSWLERIDSDLQQSAPASYQELLMFHGQWQDAAEVAQKALARSSSLTGYRYLYADLARVEAGWTSAPWQNVEIELEGEWQAQLVQAWRESQPEALLASASNSCERTEAHFFMGYAQYRAGDYAAAEQSFIAVRQEPTYGYVEHKLAEQFLHYIRTQQLAQSGIN